jgi:protein-tyrosine phosphatase
LSHTGYPEAKPRKIVHLQYLEWSDMNVPDDPRGVLGLITQVDEAVREIREDEGVRDGKKERERRKGTVCSTEVDEKTGVAKHAMGSNSPVLLHCSAGVGRTGGFIVVDAVLDALRMELRKKYRAKQEEIARTEHEKRRNDEDGMDLDVKQDIGGEEPPKTVPVQMSSGTGLSSSPSADNLKDDDQHLVVHVPLVSVGMEVDHSHSEGTAEEASPSPPPPDRHKFNKAGTRRWAQNVRDETGVEGERVSERPAQSQEQAKVSADRALYPSGSSSRTGSNPELIVHKSGNSSSSSANGDRTSRSSGSGGVYLTTTSLATSVSGASTTSSVVGGSKEKVNIGVGAETEGSCFAATAHNNEGGTHSRSSSHPLSRETVSSLSSFASSEGESPSRSMSPPDRTSGPSLQLLSHLPVGQDVTVVENHAAEPEVGDMYASEASGAHTIEAPSTTETVGGFDYKEPRPLHEDYTPPLLSTFEDPILEVIQDMREQRMSLCQSLRQYVFVHAAVIEGSLMVLDEEREFAEGVPGWTASKAAEDEKMGDDTEMMRITPEIDEESLMLRFSSPPTSSSDSGASTPSVSSVGNNGRPSLPSRSASRSRSRSTSSRRRRHYQHHHHLPVPPTHLHSSSSQSFLYPNDAVVPPSFASPSYSFSYSYGKRPSSPTELPKEDKKGRVRLSKRPSIERKRRNTDGDGDGIVRTTSSGGAATSGIGDGGQER